MRRHLLLTGGLMFLAAVGYLNFLAFRFSWYWLYWWFDLLMHFLGGLSLGLLFLSLNPINWPWRRLFLATMSLILVFSVAWELFEFSTDRQLGGRLILRTPDRLQQGVADTTTDLLADIAGVTAAGSIFYLLIWRDKKSA